MAATESVKYKYSKDGFYLAVILLVFTSASLFFFKWIVDDLYIYFRYVSNFLNGKGIAYNSGDYVEGFSSFLWFLVLSAAGLLKQNPETSAKIISLFFGVASLYLLYGISKRLIPGSWNLYPVLFSAVNLPFVMWSASGFEIPMYTFFLLLAFYHTITVSETKVILSVFLIFCLTVLRAEGFLMSIVFIFWSYSNLEKRKKYFYFIVIGYIILTSLFLAFRFLYFGDILPNTYYAKLGYGLTGYNEFRIYRFGVFYLLKFFLHNLHFAALPLLLFFSSGKAVKEKNIVFIFGIILAQFSFVVYAGGDWMEQFRFLVCLVPFFSLLSALALKNIFTRKLNGKINVTLFSSLIILFLVLNFFFNDFGAVNREKILWNNVKNIAGDLKTIIPGNSVVANGSAGIIPFYLIENEFVDVIGLTDRYIAKNGKREDIWFEKYSTDYVYQKNPGWIILWKKKDDTGKYTTGLTSPALKYLESDKRFSQYSLVKSYDADNDLKIELYKK